MYAVTYADKDNYIGTKNGFNSVLDAENWLDRQENITPFKIIDRSDCDCPVTVKDYGNYISGKYKTGKFMGYLRA